MDWNKEILPNSPQLMPGASPEQIRKVEEQLNLRLPNAFAEFLKFADGGSLADGRFIIFAAGKGIHPEETLTAANQNPDAEIPLIFIARDAAEYFGFKKEEILLPDPPIYIYWHEFGEIQKVADTFDEFVLSMFKKT